MTNLRMLRKLPGRRRGVVCLHGHARYIAPEWSKILEDCGLEPGADWTLMSPGVRVSDSRVTNCFRVEHPDGATFYFKRYVYTRYKKLRYFLRPSKASTEVFGYRQLAELGIPTLEVIAFSEHRFLGRLISACVVTRGIEESRDLETFAREEWAGKDPAVRKLAFHAIRDKLVDQIRRAHAANFFHQDLYWRNLLVIDRPEGDYEVVWIDCPRARFQRLRRRHAVLADLSTLSRLAPRYLSIRQRFESLALLLDDRPPFESTQRWFRKIERRNDG